MGTPLAQNPELFLGEDLLAWLVLAFGAALVVGNVAAQVRPPEHLRENLKGGKQAQPGSSGRPPLARSIAMIVVGLLAAVWGLASLLGG